MTKNYTFVPAKKALLLRCVMVALQILVLPVWVRVLAEQQETSIEIGWSLFLFPEYFGLKCIPMKKSVLLIVSCLLYMAAFSSAKAEKDTMVIKTNLGVMKAIFLEESPKHVALYKERIKMGAFDGTLFFRVVPGFMIQGGSPDSRNAEPGKRVGMGSTQYLLSPEFNKDHVAVKGMIAAPRQPDNINPQKKSDCSQFFIVQGKPYRSGYLDTLEMAKNNPLKNAWWKENYMPHKAQMDSLKAVNRKEFAKQYKAYRAEMQAYLENHPDALVFSEEERQMLTTQGGELKLNNEYTYFAKVVEGLEVIDAIARLKCDKNERPLQDVKILSVTLQ